MLDREKRLRKKLFRVWLFEEEDLLLNENALKACMSKSEYVRNLILHGSEKTHSKFSYEDACLIRNELESIGNGVLQIAYQAGINCSVDENAFKMLEDELISLIAIVDKYVYA